MASSIRVRGKDVHIRSDLKIGYAAARDFVAPSVENLLPPPGISSPEVDPRSILESLEHIQNWIADQSRQLHIFTPLPSDANVRIVDKSRFWEIDVSRGIAILMMILLHLANGWGRYLFPNQINLFLAFWKMAKNTLITILAASYLAPVIDRSDSFKRLTHKLDPSILPGEELLIGWLIAIGLGMITAVSSAGVAGFLFLFGMSLTIKSARLEDPERFKQYALRRGENLFGLGMLITVLSKLMIPNKMVWFGTLHLLGVSTILAAPFAYLPSTAAIITGSAVYGLGKWVLPKVLGYNLPIWMTPFVRVGINTVDQTPLLPLFSFALLGLIVGRKLYLNGRERTFELPDEPEGSTNAWLVWIGENSLALYLAQAPLAYLGEALVM